MLVALYLGLFNRKASKWPRLATQRSDSSQQLKILCHEILQTTWTFILSHLSLVYDILAPSLSLSRHVAASLEDLDLSNVLKQLYLLGQAIDS